MNDRATLERVIRKCEDKAALLNRRGCSAQAGVAEELAASFRSMLSAEKRRKAQHAPCYFCKAALGVPCFDWCAGYKEKL